MLVCYLQNVLFESLIEKCPISNACSYKELKKNLDTVSNIIQTAIVYEFLSNSNGKFISCFDQRYNLKGILVHILTYIFYNQILL